MENLANHLCAIRFIIIIRLFSQPFLHTIISFSCFLPRVVKPPSPLFRLLSPAGLATCTKTYRHYDLAYGKRRGGGRLKCVAKRPEKGEWRWRSLYTPSPTIAVAVAGRSTGGKSQVVPVSLTWHCLVLLLRKEKTIRGGGGEGRGRPGGGRRPGENPLSAKRRRRKGPKRERRR